MENNEKTALERATELRKEILEHPDVEVCSALQAIEEIFPQLKQVSKGEAIIAFLKERAEGVPDDSFQDGVTLSDVMDWLDDMKLMDQLSSDRFIAPFWMEGKGVCVPVIQKVVAPKDLPEEMNWHDAMKATDGQMGTKRDWAFIYAWKKEINDLLEQHGAEPIRDDWYWTATENSATHAWHLYFSGGHQSINTKSANRNRVRPVSAFIV